MQEKLNQLSLGEKLVAGGGILVFLASFFDWYTAKISAEGFGSTSAGESGWGAPGSIWSLLVILICVVLAGVVIAMRLGNVKMPALPTGVSWGMVFAGGAAAAVVFMLLKAWRITAVDACDSASGILDGIDCSSGFGIGFFIGVIGVALVAVGGFMLYSVDKGAGFEGLRSRVQ